MADTAGDGMGGGSSSAVPDQRDYSTIAGNLLKTHGVPTKVNSSEYTRMMSKIYSLVKATSKEQKEAVADTLVFLGIVNGTGPNAAYQDIRFEPEGCQSGHMLGEVVDGVVTRAYYRRFMRNFSARAMTMFDSSPELQATLTERAMTGGVPLTNKAAVIDFLDSSTGVDPYTAMLRTQNKFSAVARANNSGITGVARNAQKAAAAMHEYHDQPGDSLGEL